MLEKFLEVDKDINDKFDIGFSEFLFIQKRFGYYDDKFVILRKDVVFRLRFVFFKDVLDRLQQLLIIVFSFVYKFNVFLSSDYREIIFVYIMVR